MAMRASWRTTKRWKSTSHHYQQLPHNIRSLLRQTAQPVAVVTSVMPPDASSPSHRFHGATLSSFTSISLAPHPLVAFSLRVPSRMATTLSGLATTSSTTTISSHSTSHMVINILSAAQAHAARLFSRPDLHPRPFDAHEVIWSETRDGLPILHGSLGALSCRVVGAAWPLSDLNALVRGGEMEEGGEQPSWVVDGVASELFIARIVHVEDIPLEGTDPSDTLRTLPLLYHRQDYTTVSVPPDLKPNSSREIVDDLLDLVGKKC
ncbi:hypothetical protein BV25DRAFT_916357 [Artomyces pyxidatus]|uniref:Uncharacterized protein n=1 Tax=Artomyces pyxidatus TaxID=48021 RepID=A0ACB8SXL1_9AGAM|nr:hypothetical protein BV25DRAFT_916357 [Artomyces pyxidatus]